MHFFSTEKDTNDPYFLGSIVLIKEDGVAKSVVIDGQQRLTTLTILFAAICSKMPSPKTDKLFEYLQDPGNEYEKVLPKPRLALRSRDSKFFSDYIQGLNLDALLQLDPAGLANDAQRNIQKNCRYFLDKLSSIFNNDIKQLKDFVQFLLMRCYLVVVATASERSAFRVFSVMNSRGFDLLPTDIIKADVIGAIKNEEDQKTYNDIWEDVEARLGRDGFKDLFTYIRMIYAKTKSKGTLLEEFRATVFEKFSKNPTALIDDVLVPFAKDFEDIKGAKYKSTDYAAEVNESLKWLNEIDNSDWIPPAIVFLAKHRNNSAYVNWFFRRLERLASCLHISGKNVNCRIERYATLITALEGDHDLSNPVQNVNLAEEEITDLMKAISGNVYEMASRRRNYLIMRLDSFMRDRGAIYDESILTLEHVLPQTVEKGSEWEQSWPGEDMRKLWIHRLANLVPLNKKRNSAAQNYDFEKKKRAYFSGQENVSSYVLTTQVLNEKEWTPEIVEKRQEELLNVIRRKWELSRS
jgi:hypothetical protein